MFEFGEDLLDRVEVGRVFWQENEMRAGFANGRAHDFALVAAEIVHDDDVAGTKRWDENRFDVEEKALAIDGTIDEPGRLDTVMAERRKEGHRIPVTIRRLGFQAFSSWAPATQRRHICFGPGLVDKDEPSWINAILIPCPLGAPPSNVGTILLCGQKCFF